MRTAAVVLLLIVLVAGCAGQKTRDLDPAPSSAVAGVDAAFAAAAAWDPEAQLVNVIGVEATGPGPEDGDEAMLWSVLDPVPGDGAAPSWMWTFRSPAGHRNFMVQGSRVVQESTAGPEFVADLEDAKPMRHVPGSSDELAFDTVSMASQATARDRDWASPPYLNAGVVWVFSARDNPEWAAFGNVAAGLETVYGFDGETGAINFEFTGDRAPVPRAQPNLTLSDCTNFGGVFPVPMDAAREALPAGFEPIASPSDPAGGATLYVLHLLCGDSAVDGNATGPVHVAYAELAVTPPADLALAGITDYTVPLAIGASSDAVAARLADYGLGVTGKSTVSDVLNSGVGGRTLKMAFAGVTLEVDTVHAQPGPALGDGGFALIGVQDGAARTVIQARSEGGAAADAVSALQSDGIPLLEQARPAVRGFSVSGFSLTFSLARTLA